MSFNYHTQRMLDQVQEDYNPDFDLPPAGVPEVTWVDEALFNAILELEARVLALEAKNARLQKKLDTIEEGATK
jgi:hypothetical protein